MKGFIIADEVVDEDGKSQDKAVQEPHGDDKVEGPSRPVATLGCLPFVVGGVIGLASGTIHGWAWLGVVPLALLVSWAGSFIIVPTPSVTRAWRWLKPGAEKGSAVATAIGSFLLVASMYLWLVILPFDKDALDWVVRLPLFTQLGVLVLLSIVTLHFIYPLIEPKRRARLAWMGAQRSLANRSLVPIFGVAAISTAILLASHTLLLLAEQGVVRFYPDSPVAGTAPPAPMTLAALMDGGDVAWLLVWHLYDMVPAVNVNETLLFDQPLYYTDGRAGAIILLFKMFVGLGAIATVVATIEEYRAPSAPEARAASLLPATTIRLVDRMLGTHREPEPPKTNQYPGKGME